MLIFPCGGRVPREEGRSAVEAAVGGGASAACPTLGG